MDYAHATVIKVLEQPDGRAKVDILKRHDGLFEFRAYAARTIDGPFGSSSYFTPTFDSGLYATAEDAERSAFIEIGWLQRPK